MTQRWLKNNHLFFSWNSGLDPGFSWLQIWPQTCFIFSYSVMKWSINSCMHIKNLNSTFTRVFTVLCTTILLNCYLTDGLVSIWSTHWHKAQTHRCKELSAKDTVLFHQQNCVQLYKCRELEAMPIFYAVRFTLYTSNISITLLAQKLPIECLWNWPLDYKMDSC